MLHGKNVLSSVLDNELQAELVFEKEVVCATRYDCPYNDLCGAFVCSGVSISVGAFDFPMCFIGALETTVVL